jgi:hypothetical protein
MGRRVLSDAHPRVAGHRWVALAVAAAAANLAAAAANRRRSPPSSLRVALVVARRARCATHAGSLHANAEQCFILVNIRQYFLRAQIVT